MVVLLSFSAMAEAGFQEVAQDRPLAVVEDLMDLSERARAGGAEHLRGPVDAGGRAAQGRLVECRRAHRAGDVAAGLSQRAPELPRLIAKLVQRFANGL